MLTKKVSPFETPFKKNTLFPDRSLSMKTFLAMLISSLLWLFPYQSHGAGLHDALLANGGNMAAASSTAGLLGSIKLAAGIAASPNNRALIALGLLLLSQAASLSSESEQSLDGAYAISETDSGLNRPEQKQFKEELDHLNSFLSKNRSKLFKAIKEANKDNPLGLTIDPKTGAMTKSDGTKIDPSNANALQKALNLSDEDMKAFNHELTNSQKKIASLSKKIQKSLSRGFSKNMAYKGSSGSNKKKKKNYDDTDNIDRFLASLKEKEHKKDTPMLYRNIGGERIGVKEDNIFEIMHNLYKKKFDNNEFIQK